MDLKEFGRQLKEERLRQGLEIADVMEKTKISRMNLVAIEEGNEQALPHPVYAKGFVKNYARFLGMDADTMGNTLAQIYVSRDESDYDDLVLADAEKLPAVREGLSRVVGIAAGLLFLAFIGFGVWYFQDTLRAMFASNGPDDIVSTISGRPVPESFPRTAGYEEPGEREGESVFEPGSLAFPSLTEEPISESLEDAGLPELQSQVVTDALPDRPVPEAGPRTPAGTEPLRVPSQDTPPAAPPVPAADSPPVPAPDPATVAQTDETAPSAPRSEEARAAQDSVLTPAGVEKTLEIRATENCWLSAQADGARPREAFLRPGERFVITFANTLELRLGNAGGVALYIDGNQWPFSARSGEVRSVRFP